MGSVILLPRSGQPCQRHLLNALPADERCLIRRRMLPGPGGRIMNRLCCPPLVALFWHRRGVSPSPAAGRTDDTPLARGGGDPRGGLPWKS